MKRSNCDAVVTSICFAGMLLLFSLANLLTPTREFSENENKYLEQFPTVSWSEIVSGRFAAKFDTFLSDQFIGRDRWITAKVLAERALLRQDNNGVYFASDGYLIEKHDEIDIDPAQLARNTERLNDFLGRAAARLGEDHVAVLLAPTADSVLTQRLPPFAGSYDQDAMLDSIRDNLAGGRFVDIREVLREHRDEYIYYRTDHHWTTDGAFLAYRAWCDAMGLPGRQREDFEKTEVSDQFLGTLFSKVILLGTQPDTMYAWLPREERPFRLEYNLGDKSADSLYAPSYLSVKDKYSYYLGGNNALVQITGGDQNGRHLLVIKDSYAHSFVPFAAEDFESVHMVDFRYFNAPLEPYIEENGITDVLVLYNTINFAMDTNMLGFIRS